MRRSCDGWPTARSSSSTRSTTRATIGPGATSVRLAFEPAIAPAEPVGHPVPQPTPGPSRSSTTTLDEARPTTSTATARRSPTGGSCGPSTSPAPTARWSGPAPDGTLNEAIFDDALDSARSSQRLRTALSLEGEWLPTVLRAAHTRLDGGAPDPTRGRRARHRHRPGPRPGHRRAAPRPLRHRGHRRHLRRPRPRRTASPVRPGPPALAGGGADGVRGRRHPAPAGRRVRHHHDDRAVLPPGGRPPRAVDARGARPEGVPVHPRRSAAAGPGVPDRRAAPALLRKRAPRRLPERTSTPRSTSRRRGADVAVRGDLGGGHRPRATTSSTDDVDDDLDDDDPALVLELAPPPPLAGGRDPADRHRGRRRRRPHPAGGEAPAARPERRPRAGPGAPHRSSHAQVNAELNRLAGITRVTEATVTQLRSRLDAGERWLRSA